MKVEPIISIKLENGEVLSIGDKVEYVKKYCHIAQHGVITDTNIDYDLEMYISVNNGGFINLNELSILIKR